MRSYNVFDVEEAVEDVELSSDFQSEEECVFDSDSASQDEECDSGFYPKEIADAIARDVMMERLEAELDAPIFSESDLQAVHHSVDRAFRDFDRTRAKSVPIVQERIACKPIVAQALEREQNQLPAQTQIEKVRVAKLNAKGKLQGTKAKPAKVQKKERVAPVVVPRIDLVPQIELPEVETEVETEAVPEVVMPVQTTYTPLVVPIVAKPKRIQPKKQKQKRFVPLDLSKIPVPAVPKAVPVVPAVPKAVPAVPAVPETEWHVVKAKNIKPKPKPEPKPIVAPRGKTQMCRAIVSKLPCRHGRSCNFAHTKEELAPHECKFGAECRYLQKSEKAGVFFNRFEQPCPFIHFSESKDSYLNRIGIVLQNEKQKIEPVRLHLRK